MPLLTLENLCLAFGHVPLLDHASLSIDSGERVGLIGRNGAGKSSLLRIIAGEVKPDDGSVRFQSGTRLAYVSQEPVFEARQTVFATVAEGLGEVRRQLLEYHEVAHKLALQEGDQAALLDRLHLLQTRTGNRRGLATAAAGGSRSYRNSISRQDERDRRALRRDEEARGAGARTGGRAGPAAAG